MHPNTEAPGLKSGAGCQVEAGWTRKPALAPFPSVGQLTTEVLVIL